MIGDWFTIPRQKRILTACFAVSVSLVAGCSNDVSVPRAMHYELPADEGEVRISGLTDWVDSGINVQEGDALTVVARGTVVVRAGQDQPDRFPRQVGPEGTFLFSDDVAAKPFPLPSAALGPAPCYSLIARIGAGEPFFVGRKRSWNARRSGRLYLGINDFDFTDNRGEFFAKVTRPDRVQPVSYLRPVSEESAPGGPLPGSSVMVFYIDGLRPDVVLEMAAMGHIPTINRLFVEGGTHCESTFTGFPSDTITSNGTMWTGCFSDRHGLKGQVRFSRRTLHSQSYLEPLGPLRSTNLLAPQGMEKLATKTRAAAHGLLGGPVAAAEWEQRNVSGVPPIFQQLRSRGSDWATGVLPMMTEMPPILWTRSLVRSAPYLHMHEAWKYIDDANAHFAASQLIGRERPVTIVWLPETDSVSHKYGRGQFGATRRTIAQADLLIAKIVEELRVQGRLRSTYLMLVSDHGHHGGRNTHLCHFDLANQVFYQPREIAPDGQWVGGGLGLSVRQHRSWNRHKGDSSKSFVFIDGNSDGTARIFLPRRHFQSKNWYGPARPADLLAYRLAPHVPPVNLIDVLCSATAVHGSGRVEQPVDLLLMKLSPHSVLVATSDRGYAVIDRRRMECGRWAYRYSVVECPTPLDDGRVTCRRVDSPSIDPLGLLRSFSPEQLSHYYDERAWLQMTAHTEYPDSVVTLTRHMLWQENLRYREGEFAPDLVVTARRGWYFGSESTPGTTHGYPLADAMRATWFVSGPNVKQGARLKSPCRLVDLTPTILEMVGVHVPPCEVDGRPVRQIYETCCAPPAPDRPVFWNEVDLNAWQGLCYAPLKEYQDQPFTINRPDSPLDLHSLAYNVATVGDLNVFRLLDDVICPLDKAKQPVLGLVDKTGRRLRRSKWRWLSRASYSANVPGLTLSDYNVYSAGNLKRIDGTIDWAQERTQEVHGHMARHGGLPPLPGTRLTHAAVDGLQRGAWELYLFGQRLLVQAFVETLLNSVEDGTDKVVNHFHRTPAEVAAPRPPEFDEGTVELRVESRELRARPARTGRPGTGER